MDSDTLGAQFARALAVKDRDALTDLMHPEIDFRGMTPNRNWEAGDPEAVIGVVLGQWFEDKDEIEGLEGYLAECDGRIGWMRVMCSGFRPAAA